jgi:eukaryotic-like serine/threonine-protein kinase
VDPVLRRCLAKDPDQRFQTAADLKWALENLATVRPAPPEPVASTAPAAPLKPSKAAIAERFFLTLFFLLTVALGIAWFTQKPAAIQSLRFSIDAPRGTSFTNPYYGVAISPDASLLVFAALHTGGNVALWLRPLDSLEARELPGTENANGPFWSPDSKSIGFFADGKLKRIEVAGGPPQVLCEASTDQGGTWNKDGTILFSTNNTIQRVAAGGGVPAPVTTPDPSRQESAHEFPQFLEDGRTFLYFVESPRSDTQGVYAASLDKSKAGGRILATAAKVLYAPRSSGKPGELLWLRGALLVAQRFDSDTLRLQGEPVPVAEDVGVGAAGARAAFWISANGTLVYRPGGATSNRLAFIGRDGKQSAPLEAQNIRPHPRLSPDGRRAALVRNVSGGSDIWLYELGRGVMTRLTFDPAEDSYPVWSPDGRQVAFASNRGGVYQLYLKDAGGAGAEERLHQGPNPEIPLDWSSDGKYLLYSEQSPTTRRDLMILPLEGGRKPIAFAQTPFDESSGAFSPDGKWIAYTSAENGRPEVYIRASPASGGASDGKWQVSGAGALLPRWRGDGKELFYRTAAGLDAAGIRMVAGHPEIDTPHTLFNFLGPDDYDVTPDGQRFLALVAPGGITDANLTVVSNWPVVLKK